MDIEQIKELVGVLEASSLSKLVFKKGDLELHLEKEGAAAKYHHPLMVPAQNGSEASFASDLSVCGERGGAVRREQVQELPGAYVTSPMVGTFYASAAPDQPHFVKIGDTVDASTVVCIIEAMKVMNEVKAGVAGVVAEVLADNAQAVEFGTRLFRIK